MRLAITVAALGLVLSVDALAGPTGREHRLPPEDPVAAKRDAYDVRFEFVSDERMARLARVFRQPNFSKAIAVWRNGDDDRPLGKCTIYLRSDATYDVVAHEVKHCFEGHFHPRQNAGANGNRGLPKPRQPGKHPWPRYTQ
ncbi:MAG: hypothetical protein QNJ94_13260 [Alphaproteobacteria bacterium]|nr:hypothetical protein [Alphaproteobacteria bacterium]